MSQKSSQKSSRVMPQKSSRDVSQKSSKSTVRRAYNEYMRSTKSTSKHPNHYYEDCSKYDNTVSGALIGGVGGALIGGAVTGNAGGAVLGGLGGAIIGGGIGSASSSGARAACEERNRQRASRDYNTKDTDANYNVKKRYLPSPSRENTIVGYSARLPVRQRQLVLIRNAKRMTIGALIKRLVLIHNITSKSRSDLKAVYKHDYKWLMQFRDTIMKHPAAAKLRKRV
jgi:uncharacterized protein YcfJ